MTRTKLLWTAFNKGIVSQARKSVRDSIGRVPTGGGQSERQVPEAYQILVHNAQTQLNVIATDKPLPAEVATLALFDDTDGVYYSIRHQFRSYYWLHFLIAFGLAVLLFCGVAAALSAIFWNPDVWKLVLGAVVTPAALFGFFFSTPIAKLLDATFLNTQFKLIWAQYSPRIQACRHGKNLQDNSELQQAISCTQRVFDELIDRLVELNSHSAQVGSIERSAHGSSGDAPT